MITEKEDVFEITATDLVVATCRSDFSFSQLELHSPVATWTLRIEGTFLVTAGRDDGRMAAMPRITDLVGESVLLLRARKADGELEIKFTHEWTLTVESDPDHEAWEMHSSRGERLIAVPGNGVAKWGELDT